MTSKTSLASARNGKESDNNGEGPSSPSYPSPFAYALATLPFTSSSSHLLRRQWGFTERRRHDADEEVFSRVQTHASQARGGSGAQRQGGGSFLRTLAPAGFVPAAFIAAQAQAQAHGHEHGHGHVQGQRETLASLASEIIQTGHSQDAEELLTQEEMRALHDAEGNGNKPKEGDRQEGNDGEHEEEEEDDALSGQFLVSYFVAGGAAGAASRTVVSPLERLKIIMQVQPHQKRSTDSNKPSSSSSSSSAGKRVSASGSSAAGRSTGAYSGVWSGLVKMWREEGMAGFMRGNGINCLRIAPYSAVQFSTYEVLKRTLEDEHGDLGVLQRLTAGALAGIASVVSTYPLDLVRSRISIASASLYAEAKSAQHSALQDGHAVPPAASTSSSSSASSSAGAMNDRETQRRAAQKLREELAARAKKVPGIWEMTVKVYREEGGIRGLYRGCVPTSAGVAPYVALNFYIYESLRFRLEDDEGEISTLQKLACGAGAGSISQTLTYPLDVLRRRMQVAGMKNSQLGHSDKTSMDVIRTILRNDGFVGLYRGLWPNLLKVAPSIGVSFLTYETVRDLVEPHHGHHGHHH